MSHSAVMEYLVDAAVSHVLCFDEGNEQRAHEIVTYTLALTKLLVDTDLQHPGIGWKFDTPNDPIEMFLKQNGEYQDNEIAMLGLDEICRAFSSIYDTDIIAEEIRKEGELTKESVYVYVLKHSVFPKRM
jgi:hypothetical protein